MAMQAHWMGNGSFGSKVDRTPRLIRTDKNGTEYWFHPGCTKCGGTGHIHGYEYIMGGICFKCGGTGDGGYTEKVHTPEYAEKLEARRLKKARAKAEAKNAEWKVSMGFTENYTTHVVVGNTYEIKEELKADGAKYHPFLKWCFQNPNSKYSTVAVDLTNAVEEEYDGTLYLSNLAQEIRDSAVETYLAQNDTSVFFASEGVKFKEVVTFIKKSGYETMYGWKYIYSFKLGSALLIWKTSNFLEYVEDGECKPYQEGDSLVLAGTVKGYDTYRGVKQTIVTRCKATSLVP